MLLLGVTLSLFNISPKLCVFNFTLTPFYSD